LGPVRIRAQTGLRIDGPVQWTQAYRV